VKKELADSTNLVQQLRQSILQRDKQYETLKSSLLKDVVHLRDMVYKQSVNPAITSEDTFRVDYFSVADIGDEVITKLLNERIAKLDQITKAK